MITTLVLAAITAVLYAPIQAPGSTAVRTLMTVTVPSPDTELEIGGTVVAGAGLERTFETPPLTADRNYQYTVVARWQPNSYTNMSRTKVVSFRAGEVLKLDLSIDDPG